MKKSELARLIRESTGCSFLTSVEAVVTLKPWSMDLWGLAVQMNEQNVSFSDLYVKTEWCRNGFGGEDRMPYALTGPKEHLFDLW